MPHTRTKQLFDQLDLWKPVFRDIQDFTLPYRGRLQDNETPNEGKERAAKRTIGTATKALRVLSSGMQGGLTSPSQDWFRLGLKDKSLELFGPARRWLDHVEEVMRTAYRNSNFYRVTPNIYKEQAGFGTACAFQGENKLKSGIWFKEFTIGDFAIALDDFGQVNTMARQDWFTAIQIVSMFGDKASDAVKKAIEKTPYNYFKVFQLIEPRSERDGIDNQNMLIKSTYFEDAAQNILSESGFEEFPVTAPRWDVIGSNAYGYGPGWESLPDNKSLNAIVEDMLIAIQKMVDPPMSIPSSMFDIADLNPGGRTPSSGTEKVEQLVTVTPFIRDGLAARDMTKKEVDEWFFNDLFILTVNPRATATEVLAQQERQLIQLGPVIQAQFDEFLTPVINRTFSILNRQGRFMPAPPELDGQEIDIDFISVLAQAQKLIGVEKIERGTAFVGNMASIVPEVLDNFDFDVVVREYATKLGLPEKFKNAIDTVLQIREQRAQQIELQQTQENMAQAAQTAATASQAKLDDSNVLSELLDAEQ